MVGVAKETKIKVSRVALDPSSPRRQIHQEKRDNVTDVIKMDTSQEIALKSKKSSVIIVKGGPYFPSLSECT